MTLRECVILAQIDMAVATVVAIALIAPPSHPTRAEK
jgi:hypothetical protein